LEWRRRRRCGDGEARRREEKGGGEGAGGGQVWLPASMRAAEDRALAEPRRVVGGWGRRGEAVVGVYMSAGAGCTVVFMAGGATDRWAQ